MSIEQQKGALKRRGRTKQQTEELEAFRLFQRDYRLPEGTLEFSDKPDVLIHGDITLGIELTALHIQDGGDEASEQRQAKRREEVLICAQNIHRHAGGNPIELVVGFDRACTIKDVHATAKAIAKVAARIQDDQRGEIEYLAYKHIGGVNFMYLTGEYADARWRVQQSHQVPNLQVNRVKKIVADKIERAGKYQDCDELWLVITVDFWDPAQDQAIEWPTEPPIDCGPFKHVFLHKPAFRQVVEVPRK